MEYKKHENQIPQDYKNRNIDIKTEKTPGIES